MIVKNPQFEISAVKESQYPKNGLPEIVLVGKSNVGKSSFVNTMINRKKLAHTSSEPGKTRQLNFYNIDNLFYFVDLPGYGFSKMSKHEQVKVGQFIEHYLSTRKEIALIIFLGARGVENYNAFFRAAVNRDVIYTDASPSNGQQGVRKLHLFHFCAADNDAFWMLRIFTYNKIFGRQFH